MQIHGTKQGKSVTNCDHMCTSTKCIHTLGLLQAGEGTRWKVGCGVTWQCRLLVPLRHCLFKTQHIATRLLLVKKAPNGFVSTFHLMRSKHPL